MIACPCGRGIPPDAVTKALEEHRTLRCSACKVGLTPDDLYDLVAASAVPTKTVKSLGGIGVLTTDDMKDLKSATRRVAELMADGGWYSAEDIKLAAGTGITPASEGLRRMRELREARSVDIEKQKIAGSRVWRYRLVIRKSA